nr:MAG TPA: hypothetical protein [Caudoviricetes sp.]
MSKLTLITSPSRMPKFTILSAPKTSKAIFSGYCSCVSIT